MYLYRENAFFCNSALKPHNWFKSVFACDIWVFKAGHQVRLFARSLEFYLALPLTQLLYCIENKTGSFTRWCVINYSSWYRSNFRSFLVLEETSVWKKLKFQKFPNFNRKTNLTYLTFHFAMKSKIIIVSTAHLVSIRNM